MMSTVIGGLIAVLVILSPKPQARRSMEITMPLSVKESKAGIEYRCPLSAEGDSRQLLCDASIETFLGTPTLSRGTAHAGYHCGDLFCHEAPAISVNLRAK